MRVPSSAVVTPFSVSYLVPPNKINKTNKTKVQELIYRFLRTSQKPVRSLAIAALQSPSGFEARCRTKRGRNYTTRVT